MVASYQGSRLARKAAGVLDGWRVSGMDGQPDRMRDRGPAGCRACFVACVLELAPASPLDGPRPFLQPSFRGGYRAGVLEIFLASTQDMP